MTSARLFQDSSLALESFLNGIDRAKKLREVSLSAAVTDLACFEVAHTLKEIASLKELRKLELPGRIISALLFHLLEK